MSPRNALSLCLVVALLSVASLAPGQATITLIPGGSARDITPDGNYVLMQINGEAARWSQGGGLELIGPVNQVGQISDDGQVISGTLDDSGTGTAAIWIDGIGWETIGGLPGQSGCGSSLSSGYGLSGDGTAVVGLGWEGCAGRAFYWTDAGGMIALPQEGPNSSRSNVASGNGEWVGGWDEAVSGFRRPAIWDMVNVTGNVLMEAPGEVYGMTSDGGVVVGSVNPAINSEAFHWNSTDGITTLGILAPAGFNDSSHAYGVSEDGETIVGMSGDTFPFGLKRAFIWTPTDGMVELRQLLIDNGATISDDIILEWAFDISADGRTIVGSAFDAANFGFFAFVAELPDTAPSFVRGDADGDLVFNGLIDGLYVLNYQFAGGDEPPCFEAADADNDGVLNGLVDGLVILNHQFSGGPPPAAPFPDCGADDDNTLGCETPPACP